MKILDSVTNIQVNTIPKFPEFKKLEITDEDSVRYFTSKYNAYSDFNFVSMWSWNTKEEMELSELNGNLVIKFNDYLTNKPFYSFIGNQYLEDTIDKLIKLSIEQKIDAKLKLVPFEVIQDFTSKKFNISEDPDNFDYILGNEKFIDYSGKILRGHGSFKRRFLEMYGSGVETKILSVDDPTIRDQILSMNELWINNKLAEQKNIYPEIEFEALKRLFKLNKSESPFILVGIYYNGKMIGFTLDELLNHGMTIRHFMKADTSYKGVYSYLISETASILLKMGMRFTNIEQDLGLSNLRQSKKTYDPVAFLKKCTISLNE